MMQPVAIRYNKRSVVPALYLLTLLLGGVNYYIFFSGHAGNNLFMRGICMLLTAALLMAIYSYVRKFIIHLPVLLLSQEAILVSEGRNAVSYAWSEIRDWKIRYDRGTHYLMLYTTNRVVKVNISWLDQKPAAIESLLKAFQLQKRQDGIET